MALRDLGPRIEQSVRPMRLEEYLEECKKNQAFCANAAERLLKAIGEPTYVDTSKDPRLQRIFMNRTIPYYDTFKKFQGIEEVLVRLISFVRGASQGLEESKQIMCFVGPVGSGKSSLAEHLKMLMEMFPIYVLAVPAKKGEQCVGEIMDAGSQGLVQVSPVFESPLGLFDPLKVGEQMENEWKISRRRLTTIPSAWAVKRLRELKDITEFSVVELYPSRLRRIGIVKSEAGDANNTDVSKMIGKVDLSKIEGRSQNDPDAYCYDGGLCRSNQGLFEMPEMWKAPVDSHTPLITATQERNYEGNQNIGYLPFHGLIVAHSNESEWTNFDSNKRNAALRDRCTLIQVPYGLRYTEEAMIFRKYIEESELAGKPCASGTYDILAKFSVLSRLKEHEGSNMFSKMRVLNGDAVKGTDPAAKSPDDYRNAAGPNEGMTGISRRDMFKVLTNTFNFDQREIAADPVHLMGVLRDEIMRQQHPKDAELRLKKYLQDLSKQFQDELERHVQAAYIETFPDYAQNMFDMYIMKADAWIQETDYRDPDTNTVWNRAQLEAELSKIEKRAGIANPKDFRNEMVNYALRFRARKENKGENPRWNASEKMREVIEKYVFTNFENMLPVISFAVKKDTVTQARHDSFVKRMMGQNGGYTPRQVQRLVEWLIRERKTT